MTAAAKRAPDYNPTYMDGMLRAFVKQFDEKKTFRGALTGPERFVQRRIAQGQQVFDTRSRVNIELQNKAAIVYLPWPNPDEVGAKAAESLSEITGARFEMSAQDEAEVQGMTDISTARGTAKDTGRDYVLSVWGAKVPGVQEGAPERDGTHVMLSIAKATRGSS